MQSLLQAIEPGTARARKRHQQRFPKLSAGGFCAAFCADSESANGTGRRVCRRRFPEGSWGRSTPGEA
eukprot:15470201-Alexandrium_andersonii.AAC.1